MDKQQEANQIERAKAGDSAAFGALVRAYQSNLRLSVRQWTSGNHALADDIAQDAFIRAWQKLAQFDGRARFSSWLYRIAFNHWLNVRSRHQAVPELDPTEQTSAGPHPGAVNDIARAMAQLTEPQRLVIHLCLQRDFTHAEAADILNMPIGTVKTHVNRGRAALQRLMADYAPTQEVKAHA